MPGANSSGYVNGDVGGPHTGCAESGAGLVGEAEEDGARILVCPHIGRQNVGMSEGFAGFILELDVISPEQVVPPFSDHTAESFG